MLLAKGIDQGGVSGGSIADGGELAIPTTRISSDSIPVHPMGVKPLGNQYLASGPNARRSIGSMNQLPDEMILQILEYLDTTSLKNIGFSCRFLYAFCQLDDLWKALFLETSFPPLTWKGSWRSTLLRAPTGWRSGIDCSNVFSDVMHRPFVCAHIALGKYSSNIPEANQIMRFEQLSYDDFAESWSSKPFILTDCIQRWPVCSDWNIQKFKNKYSNVEFRAEAVDWSFSIYHEYMSNNKDESPLYLFDKGFAEKMDIRIGEDAGAVYWPPECFGSDLFQLLGEERPAHRWLIIGPERSGSTFHKDPNATSAWNAVLEGSKYWIMFPPTARVPGVYVSEDSSEVTSPLSIAEWLLEFHAEARTLPDCVEGVCKAGEILHVPSGWWHLVVNLEAGIALTQNFVPKSHLADVLSFLKDKPDQVTGFKRNIENPSQLFEERLRTHYPDLLDEAIAELEKRSQRKKRKWEEAIGKTNDAESNAGGFSFGFGFGDEDEDEIP
ncbi:Clavaminate synthase-like protein [Annulohypoxylon maeteangense]|uniref:Clavaminate synthase-like protein n=1 Tax=Annulohypoxylon maeteangense TaxID=1927788 RepID=UPI002008D579|nr:Clavaminate synthase-like protein [Annulohypoxylon maeteangense]KAI0889941.1 Clavaminate synthase-like protein [Annulohypoxylon maeteangense]